MACDGNCAKCPVQCGASKILEKINTSKLEEVKPDKPQNGKEQETMSEAIVKAAGCGAPKEPEEIRQNAAILQQAKAIEELKNIGCSTPLTTGIKTILHQAQWLAVIGILLAIAAIFIAWTAMRDLQGAISENAAIRQELRRIEEKAEDAKAEAVRGYNYVRKNKKHL